MPCGMCGFVRNMRGAGCVEGLPEYECLQKGLCSRASGEFFPRVLPPWRRGWSVPSFLPGISGRRRSEKKGEICRLLREKPFFRGSAVRSAAQSVPAQWEQKICSCTTRGLTFAEEGGRPGTYLGKAQAMGRKRRDSRRRNVCGAPLPCGCAGRKAHPQRGRVAEERHMGKSLSSVS